VSSLKCDRWPRPNLERAVWPRSAPPVEDWFYKPCGWLLGGRPAACSSMGALWALRAWTGLQRGAGRSTGRSRTTCQKRNRSGVEIGRHTKYNTKLSLPPFPTYTSHIHTDMPTSPPQGCAMGPPVLPWRCGLTARPVSGVEGWCTCRPIGHPAAATCRGIQQRQSAQHES